MTGRRPLSPLMMLALAAMAAAGCASYPGYSYSEAAYTAPVSEGSVLETVEIDASTEERILALDPENVSAADVRDVLSKAPAPRIINIHGGIWPVWHAMVSFSEFLEGMGYPEGRIRNPRDGRYSYSCYKSSSEIAGMIAWYYEHEGMRPLVIGHSQGGMQAVKVLHELAGNYRARLAVRNPLTERDEERDWITDPLTGERRQVVGLTVPYATAVGAGGLTRVMPNQWSVGGRLRTIPDSVEEFTGFYRHGDLLGGDLLGFGGMNSYHANGAATVRTVLLPENHDHYFVPYTAHLVESAQTRAWIDRYVQTEDPRMPEGLAGKDKNIVWAADVWTSVKRHWVKELQRLIKAKRNRENAR